MSKEEIDCDDPENEDREECQCREPDEDALYDAWADEQVEMFYEVLEERYRLYQALIKLWDEKDDRGYNTTHTNNVDRRDYLEKKLVRNLTGEDGLWRNINSIHGWFQEKNDPDKRKMMK